MNLNVLGYNDCLCSMLCKNCDSFDDNSRVFASHSARKNALVLFKKQTMQMYLRMHKLCINLCALLSRLLSQFLHGILHGFSADNHALSILNI